MRLSIIIPTYNEQRTIRELVQAVQGVKYPTDYEIIIIDDASVDRTYEREAILKSWDKDSRIRIFRNRVNKGKGFSVRKGIRRARGEIIVVQDADNEYNPQDIPKLMTPILKGESQVVFGSRFLHSQHPHGMAFLNWVANKFLTYLTNLFFNLKLTDMETCYKIFRAEVVKKMPLRANRFAFEPEVTALLARNRIAIKELPIGYSGRTAKKGKKIKARDFIFAVLTLLRYRLF